MGSEHSRERRLLSRAFAAGKNCLSVEELDMCAGGDAPPELSLHVESCAHCQAELELLRAFYADPRDPDEAQAVREVMRRMQAPRAVRPTVPRAWWRDVLQVRWFSPAAMAAAALLIVTAVGLERRHSDAPQVYAPNRAEDNVLRSGRLALIAPSGDLQSAPVQVRWQAAAGAARYEVRLFEVDHSQVWSDSTSALQTDIPQAVRVRMVPAKPWLLQITALDSAGRKLAESELVRFRILPKVYNR